MKPRQLALGATAVLGQRSLFEARFGWSNTKAGKNPPSLGAAPVLSLSTVTGTPIVTDAVGGILKANLPGLNDLAGSPGNDIVVNVTGSAGQTVRLAVAELGGVGTLQERLGLGVDEGGVGQVGVAELTGADMALALKIFAQHGMPAMVLWGA